LALHDYDKTLTRLISILSKLYNGESLSVKELAEEFNVSERTISRDFNNKLVSNFPIYKEGRRWRMQEGFRLEKTASIEDIVVLDVIENLAEGVGGNFSKKAKNLLSKIRNKDINPIYTKLNMEDISDSFNEMQLLEEAIKAKNKISFSFKNYKDEIKEHELKPLKIANYEGFWYLIGLNKKDDIYKYTLKNVSKIKLENETFEYDTKVDDLLNNSINVYFKKYVEPFDVKIRVSRDISRFIRRKPISPTQSIESVYEDGSFDIIVKITDEREITPLIKYWLPHLKILEPVSIKEIIKQDLTSYLNETI